MISLAPAYLDKVINPEVARAALHSVEPYGEFKALVRLTTPHQIPSYMILMEHTEQGLCKARIPCSKMVHLSDDESVISVELIEHIVPSRKKI